MTQEEKAKAYDEALKEAVIAHKDEDKHLKATLERIFPELKESEDKRVFEEIYKDLHTYYMIQRDKFVLTDIKEIWDDKWSKAKAWLEKQGEQKQELLTKEKALKNSPFVEQKPWSEDDNKKIDNLISQLGNLFARKLIKEETKDKYVNWLKSLKDRVQPQPKVEWSEEDCSQIETIACHLDNMGNEAMAESLLNIMDKYKSCRPQNTWKPSDEQIHTLEYYMHSLICTKYKEILFGLYSDLKKLREE